MTSNSNKSNPICLSKKRIHNSNYKQKIENNINVCYDIKSDETLKKILNNTYGNYLGNNLGNNTISHTLYPYCGEELKAPGTLNKVNTSKISKDVINILQDTLKMDIVINNYIDETKNTYSSTHNAELFYNFLKEDIKATNNDKLIVSHSKLMRKFLKYVKTLLETDENISYNIPTCDEKIIFDNLDIMMLRYENKDDNVSLLGVDIIRWKNKDNKYYDFSNVNERNHTNVVYLMRHCIGCHNIEGKNPIGLYKKTMISGFGRYAFCLPIIIDELKNEPLTQLKNLLQKFTGDWQKNNKLTFGSSIIFRAILTNSIIQHMLLGNFDVDSYENKEKKEEKYDLIRKNKIIFI